MLFNVLQLANWDLNIMQVFLQKATFIIYKEMDIPLKVELF